MAGALVFVAVTDLAVNSWLTRSGAEQGMPPWPGLATVLQGQLGQLEVAGTSRDDILEYIRSASDELEAGWCCSVPREWSRSTPRIGWWAVAPTPPVQGWAGP
jgi:hypothetical protein